MEFQALRHTAFHDNSTVRIKGRCPRRGGAICSTQEALSGAGVCAGVIQPQDQIASRENQASAIAAIQNLGLRINEGVFQRQRFPCSNRNFYGIGVIRTDHGNIICHRVNGIVIKRTTDKNRRTCNFCSETIGCRRESESQRQWRQFSFLHKFSPSWRL